MKLYVNESHSIKNKEKEKDKQEDQKESNETLRLL